MVLLAEHINGNLVKEVILLSIRTSLGPNKSNLEVLAVVQVLQRNVEVDINVCATGHIALAAAAAATTKVEEAVAAKHAVEHVERIMPLPTARREPFFAPLVVDLPLFVIRQRLVRCTNVLLK